MQVREMIETHPSVRGNSSDALIRMIEAAYSGAQTCTACADACLAEDMVADLRQCIRLNLDCADCAAAGAAASRRTGSNEPVLRAIIQACAEACRACGDECNRHRDRHDHCAVCADICARCADACDAALNDVG